MDITVRPYLTAGVALVGASAIAIAPAITPTPAPWTAAAPTVSSQAVDLSAAVNPITAWAQVVAAAAENLNGIGDAWLANPAPFLRQSLANALGYGETAIGAGVGVVEGTLNYLSFSNEDGLWGQLGLAAEQILQGEISTGFNTLMNAFLVGPLINIGLPIFASGLLEIPTKIAQNVSNVVQTFFSLEVLIPLAFGVLTPMAGALSATGDSLQASFDALVEGRLVDAVISLVNLPAAVVGAVLNGYTNSDDTWLAGLFSFNEDPNQGGLLQALLVTLPSALAAAIAPEGAEESARAYSSVAGPSDINVGSGDLIPVTEVSNGEPDGSAAVVTETTEETTEDATEDTGEDATEDTVEDTVEDPVDETTDVVEDVEDVEDDVALDEDELDSVEDDIDSVEDDTDGSGSADDAASDDDADSGDASDSGSSADSGSDSDSGSSGGDE